MPDQEMVNACLRVALHSYADAEERWQERRERGLTDQELAEAIKYEFRLYASSGYPDLWSSWPGGPSFTFGGVRADGVTYRGKRLLRMVREVLDIQEPGGRQGRLW